MWRCAAAAWCRKFSPPMAAASGDLRGDSVVLVTGGKTHSVSSVTRCAAQTTEEWLRQKCDAVFSSAAAACEALGRTHTRAALRSRRRQQGRTPGWGRAAVERPRKRLCEDTTQLLTQRPWAHPLLLHHHACQCRVSILCCQRKVFDMRAARRGRRQVADAPRQLRRASAPRVLPLWHHQPCRCCVLH